MEIIIFLFGLAVCNTILAIYCIIQLSRGSLSKRGDSILICAIRLAVMFYFLSMVSFVGLIY
jgi:hypothetical protein